MTNTNTDKQISNRWQRLQFVNSPEIAERVFIEGILDLKTPARFGGGEPNDLLDMPLLFDAIEHRALLSGASIAGALRNYLRSREFGDLQAENKDSLCTALFGRPQGDAEGAHSVLMTHDALSVGEADSEPRTELRDGVAIDPRSRTAEDKKSLISNFWRRVHNSNCALKFGYQKTLISVIADYRH